MDRMNVEDFLRENQLPRKYYDDSFMIVDVFKEEYERFVTLFEKCDGGEFGEKEKGEFLLVKDRIIKKANEVFDNLKNVFQRNEEANVKEAQVLFDDMMRCVENELFVTNLDGYLKIHTKKGAAKTCLRITSGDKYYRVRAVNFPNNLKKNDLFHIPITQRNKASNERFNVAGFPALYLSSMLPLAWQECGYPRKYYYSKFTSLHSFDESRDKRTLDEELKYISLYSPMEICNWGLSVKFNDFDLWLSVLDRYLKVYPLILACSFINYSGKTPYKQEYIIPQMLMQWIIRNNNKYNGITYFSCLDTGIITGGWCAYNIAIPARPEYDECGYSIPVKQDFEWENPEFVDIFDWKNSFSNEIKEINNFLNDLTHILQTGKIPRAYHEHLTRILRTVESMVCFINCDKATDVQLLIHFITMIEDSINIIEKTNLQTLKSESTKDHLISDRDLERIATQVNDLTKRFCLDIDETKTVKGLLNKIRWSIWKMD